MTSPDDILILELEQARTQGDDARVLGLAGAILAQHGSDQRRALAWLEEAAERLIEASRGKDFDAAVSWAKTWTRYARSPHARQRLAELQEQLNTVQACEQALVLALDAGDLGTLDASRWVNQSGSSGHPYDPHYVDQTDAWARNETFPWPFTEKAVREGGGDELTLTPDASGN